MDKISACRMSPCYVTVVGAHRIVLEEEMPGTVVVDHAVVSRFKGKSARLVVFDQAREGWGHISAGLPVDH